MSLINNKYISIYRDVELEAFYDIDLKYRWKIIIAHLMIHLLPLLLVTIYYWQYIDIRFGKVAIGLGVLFYFFMIAETVFYLFPTLRQIYKKNIVWIFIPFILICGFAGFFVGRDLMAIIVEMEKDFLSGLKDFAGGIFFISIVFVWSHVGLSQIFSASRAIYKRKAAMEADMRFASEVQNRILNDISLEDNGTRAYACSLPANELGGDYFELAIHDDQLFASIGDISGHSFGAGLLMTMTKSALQTHLEYNNDLSKIMAALNLMMLRQTDRTMYATMTLLKLNHERNQAEICNAGHLPVIQIKHKDGKMVHRRRKGIGLGITDTAEYSNLEFPVDNDDLLILYSDGLIETRDEEMQVRDSDFFEEIVKETVQIENKSPEELASTILTRVKESDHSNEMEDDSTIIIIKV